MVTSDFLTGSRNMAVLRMRNEKICNLALTCGRIAYELGYGADTIFHRTYVFVFDYSSRISSSIFIIFAPL